MSLFNLGCMHSLGHSHPIPIFGVELRVHLRVRLTEDNVAICDFNRGACSKVGRDWDVNQFM